MGYTNTMSDNIFDIIDSADYVCFLSSAPDLVYGPLAPADAMRFCEAYNAFFSERSLPGTWVARPMILPTNNPLFTL